MLRCASLTLIALTLLAPATAQEGKTISPARPVPAGKAPHMQAKLVDSRTGMWAIVFYNGDEVLSGLTDFAIAHHIQAAHFTGIGAVSSATLGWLHLSQKQYREIDVPTQVEVLSLIGDIATFNAKPIVHMHAVLGRQDGSTVGGHVWELNANPTVEVFLTAGTQSLKKRPDAASGMKLIDPAQ